MITHGRIVPETMSRWFVLEISSARRFLTWQREEEGFAACCFGANCKRDSRAKTPRNARERVNRVWVLYGFRSLFGRENCMSVYAVEFYGRGRKAVRRGADKNGERFLHRAPTPGRSHFSLTCALSLPLHLSFTSRMSTYYICIVS